MSDAQAIKGILGKQARDRILNEIGRPVQDLVTCWLHPDKTPSMSWDNNANHFHCFGCGQSYDIFNHYDDFHGLSFGEALRDLANQTGYHLNEAIKDTPLKRKSRVSVSEDYQIKSGSIRPVNNSIDSFLNSRNINPELSKNMFGVIGNESEIFLKHYEVINNEWKDCFSKRRKLDRSMYNVDDKEVKEISIADGTMCFFGLPTLWNSKNEYKKYCIITEGQLDALRVATSLQNNGLLDLYGVLSVPNGSNSLKSAIENSPSFNRWYRRCDFVILMPDCDDAGRNMVDKAGEYLSPTKTKFCDLSILTKGCSAKDISDVLDAGEDIETVLELQDYIPIQDCYKSRDIEFVRVNPGFKSGFITHDYNDSGLKEGCLTLLTGKRGQGKTTLARQMVMCSALQQIKSFCWFGEGAKEHENSRFARMVAREGEIKSYDNGSGRALFEPSESLQNRFKETFSDYIYFFEKSIDEKTNVFDNLLHMMKQYAIRGCKLFLLDNLMVMTNASGSNVFNEQKRIIVALKSFAKDYKVHILLICHPRKGDGFQAISGAAEIENTADTILRYVRLEDGQADNFGDVYNYPIHEIGNLSAMVVTEKVRDEGESQVWFLEWVKQKGIVREVAYMDILEPLANEYFEKGWFSRYYSRVDIGGL